MRERVGYFLVSVAIALLFGIMLGALIGCGPQDDSPSGGATTCAGTGHVVICAPVTP